MEQILPFPDFINDFEKPLPLSEKSTT